MSVEKMLEKGFVKIEGVVMVRKGSMDGWWEVVVVKESGDVKKGVMRSVKKFYSEKEEERKEGW